MPSASDTMATAVTKGVLKSVRKANLRLRIKVLDEPRYCGVYWLGRNALGLATNGRSDEKAGATVCKQISRSGDRPSPACLSRVSRSELRTSFSAVPSDAKHGRHVIDQCTRARILESLTN